MLFCIFLIVRIKTGVMKRIYKPKKLLSLLLFLSLSIAEGLAQNGWVNEIKYSGTGAVSEKFVEVIIEDAGNFSTDNWSLVVYNGNDGGQLHSYPLSGFTAGATNQGYSLYTKNIADLPQERGGLALGYQGKLIQFISYGGSFEAISGLAGGVVSSDIQKTMDTNTASDLSLQLADTGSQSYHFSWETPLVYTPSQLNASQFLILSDQTSIIENNSVANSETDPTVPFSLVKFSLTDPSGDGLATRLTRLVFKGKNNGVGLMDEAGKRIGDLLHEFHIKNLTGGSEEYPKSVEFPDFNTVVLNFPEEKIFSGEGASAQFELIASLKPDAPVTDHSAFSLEAQVNEFRTAASSSSLSSSNLNFEGTLVEFDVQASLFYIEDEPALVRAVKNTFPVPDGEEFSVKITAVDIHLRKDVDYSGSLSLGLKENGKTGRDLFGDDAALFPEVTAGEVRVEGLMYKSNSIPEYFQLEVIASNLPGGTAFSDPIYAVAVQDKNSTVSVVSGSGTENINYLNFQEAENLNIGSSAALGAFAFEDSPGAANDKLMTVITGLDIALTNPEYLRTIALFHGTTKIFEQPVGLEQDGILATRELNFSIGNNKVEQLQLRATFRERALDKEKISVRIHQIYTDGVGSQFPYPETGIPLAENIVVGDDLTDNINRLDVIGRLFHILSFSESKEVNKAFSLSMEAVDENGNRDLDAYPTIQINKASGPGNLNLENQQFIMNSGFLEIGGLVLDKAGLYSIQTDDISTSIVTGSTNPFRVYAPYSYEGLLISEIGQGNENGTPNYLELYNASGAETFGLENLELRVYENGSATPVHRIALKQDASMAPAESFVISNVAFLPEWGGHFTSFNPQQVNTAMVGNGNDVYELYDLFHNKVIDVYGVPGEDGSGKNWNYHESLVNRRNGILKGNNGTFNVAEFTIVPYNHLGANPGASKTTDGMAPSFSAERPVNGSQEVMESSKFVFTFSEAVNFENKAITFKRKDTNAVVYTTSLMNKAVVSGEGTDSLVIQPAQLLPSGTELYFSMEEGGVTDLAGNSISTPNYHFKTTDTIKPALVSLFPADNASNAVLAPVFRMSFSENIEIGSGTISLYSADNGSFVTSFPVTSGFVRKSAPNEIEFELLDRLTKLSSYYILASEGIVKDAAGNLFAGINSEDQWNFQTIDPYVNAPKIVKLNPLNGEMHVAQDHKLRISFHEPIEKGNGFIELYELATGAFVSSLEPATATGVTTSGNEAEINFGGFKVNTAYYVVVREGAFKDGEGNPIEGFNNNDAWVFTTVPHPDPLIVVDSQEKPLYFGNVAANTQSNTKIYRIAGRNLTNRVEVLIPAGFIVSSDGGNTYTKGKINLAVDKLEGYLELLVKFAPEVADGKLYQDHITHRSEGASEVQLELLGREGVAPATISIAEARSMGTGKTVQLRGIVTDGKSIDNTRRFIQDGTAGIALYHTNNAVLASLEAGSSVLVKGEMFESTEGLLLLGGEALSIVVEQIGQDIPEPRSLYANQLAELVESQLVEIRNLRFARAGERFRSNLTYSFTDTRGNAGELKVEGANNSLLNTEIPSIGSVRGLVIQQMSGFAILPRNSSDVQRVDPMISTTLPDGKLNFGFIKAGSQSKVMRLRVYSRELVENIQINMPEPFLVSASSVGTFSRSLSLSPSASGVDVWVRFAPVEANGQIYQDFIKLNSSSAPEVLVEIGGVEGEKPEAVTIAQARVMPLGESVQVKGIVTSGNTLSYNERYLQDATAGIVALKAGDQEFSAIPIGAEIKVGGYLQETGNLLQIGGALHWEILTEKAGELNSLLLNSQEIGEQHESKLVRVEGISFIEEGYFEGGKKYKFIFSSGESGWLKMPLGNHPLLGESIPYKANLRGVLSQAGEDYVIIPRLENDLQAIDAVITTEFPEGAMEFFFVPANTISQPKYFMVKGANLQGVVHLSTSSPFEVSTTGTSYSTSATIPQEGASEVKVYIRFKPVLAGGSVSNDFLTIQTTNGRLVKVPLTGIEGTRPEVLSIAQARALGAGERVKVQGILTSGKDFFAGKRFIQDISAGLLINGEADQLLQLEAGDKVEIAGDLLDRDGLLHLEGNLEFRIIEKALGFPVAREITSAASLSEENEAELLSLSSVRFVKQGYFEQGRSYTIFLENGEESLLRIAGDNNSLAGELIPARAGLKGVLAQKGSRYEIWPRNVADLEVLNYPVVIIVEAPSNGFDFGRIEAGTASQWEQYSVTGVELSQDITVSVAAPFEISFNKTDWLNTLIIAKDAVKKEVYVRFNPQTVTGNNFIAELVHTSASVRSVLALQAQEGAKDAVQRTEILESFDQCLDLNSFYRYDVTGAAQWGCSAGAGVNNSGAVGIYHDQQEAELNEDWLISPAVLVSENSRLSFDISRQHQGAELELLISTDYLGSGNPKNARWDKLAVAIPAPSTPSSSFETVKGIDLGSYAGQEVYVSFRYTATYEEASHYFIDNFILQDVPLIGFAERALDVQEGTSEQILLILSHPAPQATTIVLNIRDGNGTEYGEQADYLTSPAKTSNSISLPVDAGVEEVSFNFSLLEDMKDEGDEQIIFRVAETGTGLLINEDARQLILTLKSNNASAMSISAAREVTEQGMLTKANQLVKLTGVAYGPNLSESTNGLEFRLIDHAAPSMGAITIKAENLSELAYKLQSGNELEVTGILKEENGLAILQPHRIKALQAYVALKEAEAVSSLSEEKESHLVELENVELVSGWQTNPSESFMVTVKNVEGVEYQVQIRTQSGLYSTDKPEGRFNIVGFVGQKDTSVPYNGGYYLLPGSNEDLRLLTGLQTPSAPKDLVLYPNPASTELYIRSVENHRFVKVEILSLKGSLLRSENYREGAAVDLEGLGSGLYLLKIRFNDGGYSTHRISVIK